MIVYSHNHHSTITIILVDFTCTQFINEGAMVKSCLDIGFAVFNIRKCWNDFDYFLYFEAHKKLHYELNFQLIVLCCEDGSDTLKPEEFLAYWSTI
jgi:hypothetical protein